MSLTIVNPRQSKYLNNHLGSDNIATRVKARNEKARKKKVHKKSQHLKTRNLDKRVFSQVTFI